MDKETDEQYAQRSMAFYNIDTVEELLNIEKALSLGQEEGLLNELTDMVKAEKYPNIRDIAFALRVFTNVPWPVELREYAAQLLLGETKKPKRKPIFTKDGKLWWNDRALKLFMTFPYDTAIGLLGNVGINKTDALELICKAQLLELMGMHNLNIEKLDESFVKNVENLWNRNDDYEIEDQLERLIRKANEIVYPRKR